MIHDIRTAKRNDLQMIDTSEPIYRVKALEHSNSTETQTEFFIEESPCLSDLKVNEQQKYDDDEDFGLNRFYMEAETQFDLDDILCSNYTQTGKFKNQ